MDLVPSANIVSDHNTSENTILDAYKRQVGTLDERAYNYAKAVACLRLIYVYKVCTNCTVISTTLSDTLYLHIGSYWLTDPLVAWH